MHILIHSHLPYKTIILFIHTTPLYYGWGFCLLTPGFSLFLLWWLDVVHDKSFMQNAVARRLSLLRRRGKTYFDVTHDGSFSHSFSSSVAATTTTTETRTHSIPEPNASQPLFISLFGWVQFSSEIGARKWVHTLIRRSHTSAHHIMAS